MRLVRSLGLVAVGFAAASCAEYAPPPVAAPAPVVRPLATATAGAYCREYQGAADIGGGPQTVYGMACQQPDGTWRLVDAAPAAVPPPAVQSTEIVRYAPYPVYYPAPYYGYPYYGYSAPYYGPPYYGPRVSVGAAFVFGHGRHRW